MLKFNSRKHILNDGLGTPISNIFIAFITVIEIVYDVRTERIKRIKRIYDVKEVICNIYFSATIKIIEVKDMIKSFVMLFQIKYLLNTWL